MLAGSPVSGVASAAWFGAYADGQSLHAQGPTITASATSTSAAPASGINASGQLDWIVQIAPAADKGVSSAAGAAALLPQAGKQFQVIEGLGAVGELLARSYGLTTAQATAALQADRQISWFEADSLKQIDAAVPNDSEFSQQWDLDNTGQDSGASGDDIDATAAWNITTGSRNVVVAVIDSGVDYTDPDLATNIWTNPNAGQDGFSGDVHGYNFVNNTGNPTDDNGHGTFVAGEIGAVGNNGLGVAGVDWNVTIMPLKFLDANGNGYTSDAIRAINYAVMEKTEYGVNVRVINASWSSSVNDPGLDAAITAAGNAGILVVAAAGNYAANNDATPQYPASSGLANVVSVAASTSSDQLASFSDYGPNTVNLAAPGVDIYGTLPSGKYGYLSGTSMAAPLVSGAAALAWAVDPGATVAQVRSALLQGVTPVSFLAGKVSSGGCLNVYNTLKLLVGSTVATATTSPAVSTPASTASAKPATTSSSSPTVAATPPATLAGTNVATAVALEFGSSVQGSLTTTGSTDYFKVQVAAGQKYTFQAVLGSINNLVLTLLASNGQTVLGQSVALASGNRTASITWSATQSGAFYLAVGTFSGSPGGTFTLSASKPATPSNPAAAAIVVTASPASSKTNSTPALRLEPAAVDTLFSLLGR